MTKCQCFFCETNRFALNKELNLPAEEAIVWEDENVFVIPDLFPLCVGHFLVVTKYHYASFGNVPQNVYESSRHAIEYLKHRLLNGIEVIIFEHGAVIEHTGGSSIDHAHIHIMPLKYDIRPLIEKSIFINEIPQRGSYLVLSKLANKNQPYIYYQRNSEVAFIYPVDKLPSQFLRIIIAQTLGISYNWKIMKADGSAIQRFLDTLKLAKGENNEKAN